MNTLNKITICLSASWSGFFVMSIELLGGKILAPFFGSSIFVWGGIITVFMLCLSIGYLIGGQLSTKAPTSQKLAILLIGEALLALPIVGMGDVMLEWLSYLIPDPRYGSLLSALLLFGAPTVMSGMISPYAVRLLVADIKQSGRSAGQLYFASTLGSAAGTIVTSFYLVLYFELNGIILSLCFISAIIAAATAIAGRQYHADK